MSTSVNGRYQMGMLAAAVLLFGVAPSEASTVTKTRPAFGLWYTAWWTQDDRYQHWGHCQRLPLRGKYTAGDPAVIAADYAQFRELGVDFLIMDDTNGADNDGGRIKDNIRAWFEFMDARTATERIPICIAGGGEMRSEGRAGQQRAADFYWAWCARRPSYFRLQGRPLLLVDTDKNTDPAISTTSGSPSAGSTTATTMRPWKNARPGDGAVSEPARQVKECMSIWPGHRFPIQVAAWARTQWKHPRRRPVVHSRVASRAQNASPIRDRGRLEQLRGGNGSGGQLRLGRPPRIRGSRPLSPHYPRYSRLRNETLVKGEYFRSETDPKVFLFDGQALVYQAAMPRRAAVILVPDALFQALLQRWPEQGR